MKVLHVTGCYLPATEWGGPPPAIAAWAAALRDVGVASEIFTTTARGRGVASPIAPGTREVEGTRTTYFRALDGFRSFLAPGLVPALARRLRAFDLVHVHMLWAFPGIAAARAAEWAGVPYVVTPHGCLDPWALGQKRRVKQAFLALAETRTLERAALLHFTTDAEHARAPERFRALPSAVVPVVVDAAPFEALGAVDRRAASREVLVLGRIHEVKGFDVLLPAWRRVVAAVPDARLVVAGPDDGGYRATVEASVRTLGIEGSVRFTGHLDGPARARALEAAAALASPSHQENFGVAIAEAMAAGLPVVVSEAVSIADDVARAGAGLVVPRSPDALAAALLRLLGDAGERDAMGRRGRALVRERYAAASVGAALRDAYARALAAPRRRRASVATDVG